MSLRTTIESAALSALASVWPDPAAKRKARYGIDDPTDPEYLRRYAVEQYMGKVSYGVQMGTLLPPLWGKEVLEIGCGHGGITCYFASVGARRALGVDVNEQSIAFAHELAAHIAETSGRPLPAEFQLMDGTKLDLEDASFDVVIADNFLEHVHDPQALLHEVHRILRNDGHFVVPVFSSIVSKWGLHLKHGLRLPWANLVFSEPAIVEALRKQAELRPELYDAYPGLRGQPERIRDVRKHKDLNDITYGEFRRLAAEAGFKVKHFHVHTTPVGKVVRKLIPRVRNTKVEDVLSTGAAALLVKR